MQSDNRVRDRAQIDATVGRTSLDSFLRNTPQADHPVCLSAESLALLIDRIEELARYAMPNGAAHVRLRTEIEPELVFLTHRPSLFRCLMVLIENAFDAAAQQKTGRIIVAAHGGFGEVSITVSDNGPGLPEAWQDTLRSKAAPRGASGLPEAAELARHMGGELRFIPTCDGGTALALDVPDGSGVG